MSRTRRSEVREAESAVSEHLRAIAQDLAAREGRRTARSMSLARARESLFFEAFVETARRVFADKITPSGYSLKKSQAPRDRIVNLILSDTHFGSLLDVRELGHSYGHTEEARRLAAVVKQAVDYKTQYRKNSELFLHLAGDIIQGQLHDMRDGAPLAQQCAAAIHLLVQAVGFLAQHYPMVTVRATPGNHGRNTARHRDRATNQKWDSIEQVIYYSVKEAVKHLANVKFELGYQPSYTYRAFNRSGFITHGDTVINPGYPGRTIDVGGVRKQINEINGGLKASERYSLFAVGHVHVGSIVNLPNESVFLSNGCLIPPDAYSKSIGIFDTACGQYLWESVEDYIVGDSRFLLVDERTDADSSLDEIIEPFSEF